jgi:YHS domain-containing protein
MEVIWLWQNWGWVVLGIGAILYFRAATRGPAGGRNGHGIIDGGHGGRHFGAMGAAGGAGPRLGPSTSVGASRAAVDPVDGGAVRTTSAFTCLYAGRIYYFSSCENRERFEAAPWQYVHRVDVDPVRTALKADDRPDPESAGSVRRTRRTRYGAHQ